MDRIASEAERTDHNIAKYVVFAYFVAVLALLPMNEWARALITGAGVFLIVLFVARRFASRITSGMSVMIVAFASMAVLAMPTLPAMGGSGGRASIVGFYGVQAAALLWAALWWPGSRSEPEHVSLGAALRFGLLVAVGLSAIAAIPVLLILMTGTDDSWPAFLVFPAYSVGCASAALIYWVLQRIEHLAVGRYLTGVLGGICVYGAMGPVVALSDRKKFDISEMMIVAFLAGGFVGPAVALSTDGSVKTRIFKTSRLGKGKSSE